MTAPALPRIVRAEDAHRCPVCGAVIVSGWRLSARIVICWGCAADIMAATAEAAREYQYDRNHPYGIGGY